MGRSPITVGGITVNPGERAYGFLHVGYLAARTEVRIPIHIIHGQFDGPTVCLEGTLHGWEPMGAEVLRRALQKVDPAQVRGTILCLPLANPMSVEFGGTIESTGTRVNPVDLLDLNRVWPGKTENAWLTEQMAAIMWNEVIKKCEYVIDYHDGTGACDELPVVFGYGFPKDMRMTEGEADGIGGGPAGGIKLTGADMEAMNQKILGLAKAFGSSISRWRETPINPAMLMGSCLVNGIIPLVVETGGGGMIDYTIDWSVDCTLNVLKHLNMIDGDLVLPKRQIMVSNYQVMRSKTGGFYQPEPGIVLEAEVKKGQLLGRVVDPLTSEVTEECRSPVNGIIVSRRIRMPLNPGGYIAHIADTDSIIWERHN